MKGTARNVVLCWSEIRLTGNGGWRGGVTIRVGGACTNTSFPNDAAALATPSHFLIRVYLPTIPPTPPQASNPTSINNTSGMWRRQRRGNFPRVLLISLMTLAPSCVGETSVEFLGRNANCIHLSQGEFKFAAITCSHVKTETPQVNISHLLFG